MARVSSVIQIDATPQEVWEVGTDLGRTGEWVTIHRKFEGDPPRELTAGSRFRQTLKVAGVTFHVEWTAVEVDGPRRLVWDGTGPAGTHAHTSYALAAEGGGKRFSYENDFTLPAGRVGKAAARAVAGQAKRQLDASLKRLKKLVES